MAQVRAVQNAVTPTALFKSLWFWEDSDQIFIRAICGAVTAVFLFLFFFPLFEKPLERLP